MSVNEAVLDLYSLLKKGRLEKEIKDLHQLVFSKCLEGKTYKEIAEDLEYDYDYIRQIGSQIWNLLSETTKEKVTKTNFKSVLHRHSEQHESQNIVSLEESLIPSPLNKIDWSEAINVPLFYGRTEELTQLKKYILDDRCRLITLLAMGGMGKTALSIKLSEEIQEDFDFVIWKSMRNAPNLEDLLTSLIKILSQQKITQLPTGIDEKIALLLSYLQSSRYFIVLDNLESILQSGGDQLNFKSGQYLEGYEDYEKLLQQIAEKTHSSCFLLTSREQPQISNVIAGEKLPVRLLKLGGLSEVAGREFFKLEGEIEGSEREWKTVIQHYAGNPLALKMVAPIVQDYFTGNLTKFITYLTEQPLLFDDIQNLLDRQFNRLSYYEKGLMYSLAILREQVSFAEIEQNLYWFQNTSQMIEEIRSLERRSLIEKSPFGFTQQPVVMEYMTQKFIEEIAQEIQAEELHRLHSHPIMQATAKDYVKASQIRMIVTPLLRKLRRQYGDPKTKLQQLLSKLQQEPQKTGYSAGNLLNLFIQLGVDLTDYDFSHLAVWQADLQNVNLQNVNFTGADLSYTVFRETFGGLLSVAYSPDGELVATGDTTGEVRIRLTRNYQQTLRLSGHWSWVWCVVFSPDGTKIASGGIDQTIRIWDVNTGECLQILRGHENVIFNVTFNAEGTFLASGGDDQTARIWDLNTGESVQVLRGHSHSVRSVKFDDLGTTLISGSSDNTIKVWNLETGECRQTLSDHTKSIWSVAYTRDHKTIVSVSYDKTIKQWDVATGECLQTLEGHTDQIYTLTVHPQKNLVASAGSDSTIKIWDLSTGCCLNTLFRHDSRIFDLDWSPDGKYLASAGQDQLLKFWDVSTGECVKTLSGYTNTTWSVSFSPEGKTLASGSDDGIVRLWNLETDECIREIPAHRVMIYSVAFSASGKLVGSSSPDCRVKLWDVETGENLQTFLSHSPPNRPIAFHPEDKFFVSNERDTILRLSDVQTGQVLQRLEGHTTTVSSVTVSQDGAIMASGSIDGIIIFWDLSTFEQIGSLQTHKSWIWSSCFHPFQKILATGGWDGTAKFWDLSTGECLQVMKDLPKGQIAVSFSPQGQWIAIGSLDKTIQLWDFESKQLVKTLTGHSEGVVSLAFHPQENLLASSSMDGTIKLWNVPTGDCLKTLRPARPYEKMKITETTGISESEVFFEDSTEVAIANLKSLGAVV